MNHILRVSLLSLTVLGCAPVPDPPGQAPVAAPPVESPAVKTVAAAPSAAVSGDRIKGKVVQKMDAGSYTYILVEIAPGQQVWAAGPKSVVAIGKAVDFEKGMEMRDFTSKSLKKTFNSIYFVGSFGLPKVARGAATSQPASQPAASQPARPAGGAGTPTVERVKKAAGGLTVAEVFAKASALDGKSVQVRGRVVKFNAGIMGKNWLHLRDGTGDASQQNHDLTVTSDGVASVGQIVLIKGTLRKDKDFGAGYTYSAMVENASITVD